MEKKYLVALDQGTTSSRAVVFTFDGRMIGQVGHEFPQHYPAPGWVERWHWSSKAELWSEQSACRSAKTACQGGCFQNQGWCQGQA